jgi:membrane-associated phospholipid phosphatase
MMNAGGPTVLSPPDTACAVEISVPPPSLAVNLTLATCSAVMLGFSLLAQPPGAWQAAYSLVIATPVVLAPMLVPVAWWHQHKDAEKRDAALMLPWAMLLAALVAQMAATAATFQFPLRDPLWHNLDVDLGINIPAVMAWAAGHPSLQSFLAYCYNQLHPMMLVAILLLPLFGKRKPAERYIVANALGFVIGLPLMVFLPAIGPWVTWHFLPSVPQTVCESGILMLRHGSIPADGLFGATVCLPSFHTFWAVLTAQALWTFRLLRYPAILLATLIIASTMTIGWHYGVDVIAGVLLAGLCSALASWITSIGRSQQ